MQINEARQRNIEIAKKIIEIISAYTVTHKGKQQTVDVKAALYLLVMRHGPQVIADIIAYTIVKYTAPHFSGANVAWAKERTAIISRDDLRYLTLHRDNGVFACEVNAAHTVINDIATLLRGG